MCIAQIIDNSNIAHILYFLFLTRFSIFDATNKSLITVCPDYPCTSNTKIEVAIIMDYYLCFTDQILLTASHQYVIFFFWRALI